MHGMKLDFFFEKKIELLVLSHVSRMGHEASNSQEHIVCTNLYFLLTRYVN